MNLIEHRTRVFPAFLLAFLVLAFKSNDALTLPQFFAEDVSIFFKGQLGHSLPQLWVPYAGYLHVMPRLIAWIGTWFGIAKAPLVYNLAATLLDAAAVAYTCHRLRSVVPFPLAMLTFMAVPVSGEILGTITNAQWFLQFALAAACFTEAENSPGWPLWVRDLALFLLAVTGPFSIFVMLVVGGLAAASWLDRRLRMGLFEGYLATFSRRFEPRVIASIGAGAVIQVMVLLTHAPESSGEHQSMFHLLRIAFTELAPIHVFGADFLTGNGWLVVYALLFWGLIAGKHVDGGKRLVVLAMLVFASAEMFAPISMRDVTPVYQFMLADRYFYVFKVVFWWAVFTAVVAKGSLSRHEAALTVATFIGLVAVTNPDHLRRRPFVDYHWKQTARELQEPGPHTVYSNPPGWGVVIETPARETP
ncbi:hypothetical protein [Luteibacter aegosomatissinici]|uniref:hypothetical protein n=1 Tax=Luteibacter aegosomatissinici TaxID=2911539 RepID=UPI001FF9145F|nr:hypothetical protein [Luteibacter aegosomatissinici]UPG95354.1 hypothetical protein L2Y97_04350 [Luteibacter aegosomatissinici]